MYRPPNDRMAIVECPDCGASCPVSFSLFTTCGNIVHLAVCGSSCKDHQTFQCFTKLPRQPLQHTPSMPQHVRIQRFSAT